MFTASLYRKIHVLFLIVFFISTDALALDPSWTFSDNNRQIDGILVSPDGSGVIGAAGRVILLSRDGSVLSKEPFGELITQSRDGSTIVSVYSSTMTSTIYCFGRNPGTNGTAVLQKKWEVTLPNKVRSMAITDKGDRVVLSTGGTIHVYDGKTGKYLGSSKEYSSSIAISARGGTIAGVSAIEGFKVYTSGGTLKKKYDLVLSGQPDNLLMNANGTVVVFKTGPHVVAVNVSDGQQLWKRGASGDISSLAMDPAGTTIIAGTETGIIECYDAEGNQTWKTSTATITGSSRKIESVAITADAAKIVAGSDNGWILFLDSDGNIVSEYYTTDQIGHVAIAADGSLTAAGGVYTIYAFLLAESALPTTYSIPNTTIPRDVTSAAESPTVILIPAVTSEEIIIKPTSPEKPKTTVTEYSIIRKPTQKSPLDEIIPVFACLAAFIFIIQNRH